MANPVEIIAVINGPDYNYSYRLEKVATAAAHIRYVSKGFEYLVQFEECAEKFQTNKFICTNLDVIKKLLYQTNKELSPEEIEGISILDFAGTMIQYKNLDILVLPPLQQLVFGKEQEFLFAIWVEKLWNPNFPIIPELKWAELVPETYELFYEKAKTAYLIGIDIETRNAPINPDVLKLNPQHLNGMWVQTHKKKGTKALIPCCPMITMVGYTLVHQNPETKELSSVTGVLIIDSPETIELMRKLNLTSAPKVMQNGIYDCSYFLRYRAPVSNYLYDTHVLMHSWVCELRRNLNFISSLFNKHHFYWKDDGVRSQTLYNAKDVHNTTWDFIYMLNYLERNYPWALTNYAENFRYTFPNLQCTMEGMKIDEKENERLLMEEEAKMKAVQIKLDAIIHPDFNPASPNQVKYLIKALGTKDIEDTNEKSIDAWRNRHPLFDLIGGLILDFRGYKKAISTYFTATLYDGRFLYQIGCATTDTSRFSSSESPFWCGSNIQNQPLYAKSMYVPDAGYEFNCCDYSQSESRTTAYISEDENLIRTVESPLDFHKVNCTLFFGLKYEHITKEIRDVGKRVNHGSNYNMGGFVLLQTMGLKAVLKARDLLGLSKRLTPIKICEHLLSTFTKAYPKIKGKYYQEVIRDVETTGLLIGATGWVRKCFGNPAKNKLDLNAYVAHPPQSLSVKRVNSSFFRVWRELQIEKNIIRLKAQIHDEIFWQSKPEYSELSGKRVKEIMEEGIIVNGRMMVIPAEMKLHAKTWKGLK